MHEGCKGERYDHAFEFISKSGGLASNTDYPYTATQGVCADNKPSSLSSNITGFGIVPYNNETTLLAAVANQPVSVSINIDKLQFTGPGF